jgi:hypothetical protein
MASLRSPSCPLPCARPGRARVALCLVLLAATLAMATEQPPPQALRSDS